MFVHGWMEVPVFFLPCLTQTYHVTLAAATSRFLVEVSKQASKQLLFFVVTAASNIFLQLQFYVTLHAQTADTTEN